MFNKLNGKHSWNSFQICSDFLFFFLAFIQVWTQWVVYKVNMTSLGHHPSCMPTTPFCSHSLMNVRKMKSTIMFLSIRTGMGKQYRPRSGSTLFAIPHASFGHLILWWKQDVTILGKLQQFVLVSEFLRVLRYLLIEPRHKKTCLRGFWPGKTQTSLCSYRTYLEAWNFGYRN